MELIAIILSGLLAFTSGGGFLVEQAIAEQFRSQFAGVEKVEVRVDNTPSYDLLGGKIQRFRLASRGVELKPKVRIDTLEVETDPISLELKSLPKGSLQAIRKSLRQPLQGAIRLGFLPQDLTIALETPLVKDRLEKLINQIVQEKLPSAGTYQLLNPKIDLLGKNRLAVSGSLKKINAEELPPLDIQLELSLELIEGKTIQIVEPTGMVNGKKLSRSVLNSLSRNINKKLDLQQLEQKGIFARLLQLNIEKDRLDVAAFIRWENLTSSNLKN